MNQEQLPLEICQEIGHLFPNAKYAYGKQNKSMLTKEGEPTVAVWDKEWLQTISELDEITCEILANHPSITDMVEWLFLKGKCNLIKVAPTAYWLADQHGNRLKFSMGKRIMENSPIKAYAQAVKLVMEMER
jgi:hypothetical protein